MKNPKFKLWDEVFVVFDDGQLYEANITKIDISINEEWTKIEYWVAITFPLGITSNRVEYGYCYSEEKIFASAKEGKAFVQEKNKEKREKEERRKQYNELKKEFWETFSLWKLYWLDVELQDSQQKFLDAVVEKK